MTKTVEPGSAYAVVTLTVEVRTKQPWGPDCAVGQIFLQALKEAQGTLAKLFAGNKQVNVLRMQGVRVVCKSKEEK